MKKIFFFAAAVLTAVTMNAETVYQWGAGNTANQVGSQTIAGTTTEESVKIDVNTKTVSCFQLKNGYATNGAAANYIELTAKEGSFLTNDVVIIEFCYNNSASKVATVAVYDPSDDAELAASGNGKNGRTESGVSEFTYTLTKDMAKIRVARAKTGGTTTCVTGLKVVRGEAVEEKPVAPSFSVLEGKYFEPFKVGLSSSKADAIYFKVNDGEFQLYSDSISIDQYETTTKITAYSTLNELKSDEVSAEYVLAHFVPRTIFKAREELVLSGLQADDIEILDNSVAAVSKVTMDGVEIPSVSYIHQNSTKKKSDGTFEDSTMCISFKSQPGLKFIYKNKANKDNIMRLHKDFLICDGSNFEMHIDSTCGLQPNDTVIFVVTAKTTSSPSFSHEYSASANLDPYEPEDEADFANYTDGSVETAMNARIDNDYSGWTNLVYIVKPTKKTIKLKETAAGFRIAKIQIGAYREAGQEGITNTEAPQKAMKRIVNGQVVIEKGGRLFNLLGAEIK